LKVSPPNWLPSIRSSGRFVSGLRNTLVSTELLTFHCGSGPGAQAQSAKSL
jgi:hypothetical protein